MRKNSKTAFILGLPHSMPAAEVVARAKKAGMKLSDKYVYNIRSAHRTGKKQYSSMQRRSAAPRAESIRRAAPAPQDDVHELRRLIAETGLIRARQVLAELEGAWR